MKKAFCLIALAAISFTSVMANPVVVSNTKATLQDTVKKEKTHKMKKKMKRDTTMKKDTTKM